MNQFVLYLELPFKTTIVLRNRFNTEEEAEVFAKELPGPFLPASEDTFEFDKAIEVPVEDEN